MNFIILIAFLIPLWKLHFRKENFENYISPVQTTAINGFFVMLVFMRHINQYLDIGKYDGLFKILDSMLGQLIVTTFLFYSGYGIMYSIKNKNNYINSMPKRIVKILLQFDMAIVFYIFVNLVIGENLFWKDVLEALVAWKSLGNSTWYIFAILCLYGLTFVAGKISNNYKVLALLVTVGALLYILILKLVGKESHWYNTALCSNISFVLSC